MSDIEGDRRLHSDADEHPGDVSPGDEPGESAGHWVFNSNLGLGFSIALTIASFWAVSEHIIYGPAIPIALIVLAVAQMGVHLVFFLHITTGPDNTNNVLALAFGILVVGLVVGGSIWIMSNLNGNMMPMNQLMQMQP